MHSSSQSGPYDGAASELAPTYRPWLGWGGSNRCSTEFLWATRQADIRKAIRNHSIAQLFPAYTAWVGGVCSSRTEKSQRRLVQWTFSISLLLRFGCIQMTFQELQQLIRDRYYATDSARGCARTFLWLTEEFGELAEEIAKYERGDGDQANLRGEFADVLAWLATLANITGVDLAEAIDEKYIRDGGPAGTK